MAELMVRYDDLRRYCEKRHCGSVPLEYIKQMQTIAAEITAPPKSNADRIRQMTDEELAEFIDKVTDCCSDGWMCEKCPINRKGCDKDRFIEWLKMEARNDG